MRRRLVLAAALGGGFLACGGTAAWFAWRAYIALGPAADALTVLVPRGTSAQLAELLTARGVIRSPHLFRLAARATAGAGPLRAGEFRFAAGISLRGVLDVLRTGRPVRHSLTIPEGLTAAQIGRLVAADPALDGEVAVPAEGAVQPETYVFERPARADALLHRAAAARRAALAAAWAGREAGLPLASAESALVLASIVEKETRLPEERPMVAAVFLNRLRLGMKLQADPTTAYAASGGMGALPGGLTRDELDTPGPYNTYSTPGLPAGPICAPGAEAVAAVLHPAHTAALYFVADGSGGHSFAATLAEHVRNVARWRERK